VIIPIVTAVLAALSDGEASGRTFGEMLGEWWGPVITYTDLCNVEQSGLEWKGYIIEHLGWSKWTEEDVEHGEAYETDYRSTEVHYDYIEQLPYIDDWEHGTFETEGTIAIETTDIHREDFSANYRMYVTVVVRRADGHPWTSEEIEYFRSKLSDIEQRVKLFA